MNLILLFFALTGTAYSLSCYGLNGYNNPSGSILENKKFCSSFYETATGYAVFGGHERPINIDMDLKMGDCQLKMLTDSIEKKETEYYVCICDTSMCNFPFSFAEFSSRGFTLSPKIVN